MKTVSQYVSEIFALKDRKERVEALSRVPPHLQQEVKAWVERLWAGKKTREKLH